MSLLPITALPYIPSVFSAGDRLSVGSETLTRDEKGRWVCEHEWCPCVTTDAGARSCFTDPELLVLFGVPLLSPAPVPADEPLPGRPVAVGEQPFEERPYLMVGTGPGDAPFQPLKNTNGPWGPAQRACTPSAPDSPTAFTYEMTLTDTGTVWFRLSGNTFAYVPAETPTDAEAHGLMSVAVLRAAFDLVVTDAVG